MYTILLLLIFFSLLQIRAIRISSSSSYKDSDEIKRSELYRKFFNGRSTKKIKETKAKGFQENKRQVPSCPDALHN